MLFLVGTATTITTLAIPTDTAMPTVGLVTALIGVPIWITGVTHKNDIQIQLIQYQSCLGIGLKIRF
jgi:hypothetical protein